MLYMPMDFAILIGLGVLAIITVGLDYEFGTTNRSEATTAIVSSAYTALVIVVGYVIACLLAGTL